MSAVCCDEIYWRDLSYGVYNTIYCGSLCHIIVCSYFFRSKKELFYCGFTGALGWIIYYIIVQFDMGVVFPSLIATLCLTIMARIFAAARSMPVTVYLLSGIFPLVPGAGIFYTAYYLLRMTEHFPPQRVLKPLRWRVPSCSVSYSGLAYRRVCLIC